MLALAPARGALEPRTGTRSDKYSRVNQYTSYGKRGLGAQEQIAAAYEKAQHAPPPTRDVEVYNASLPPGISLEHGVIQVADDAPYEAIGRYEIGYWLDSAPKEPDVRDDLVRLAAVTNAPGTDAANASPPSRRPRHARLAYHASAPGCLEAGEFADEVSARLRYSPWREDADTAGR